MSEPNKAKSIIIMGTGPSIRECDFKADEIWGVNGAYSTPSIMPPKDKDKFWMTKLFITDWVFSRESGSLNFDVEDVNSFSEHFKCQVLSLHYLRLGKHILNAKKIPYKQLVEYFGDEYYTDSVCYMIAYALYKHSHLAINPKGVIRPELKFPLHLKLFGIDMVTSREYQQSKGGVEHWLGVARGMGCQVDIAKGSAIMAIPGGIPYGWECRRKLDYKVVDPMGLIKGNNLSPEQQTKYWEKWDKEHEQGNRDTNTEGNQNNQR